MSKYFPEPRSLGRRADLKTATGMEKVDLANLKSNVDKLDI